MIEPIDSLQKKFNKIYSCTSPTGIKDNSIENYFTIYPNPANDLITINGNYFNSVEIYSVLGTIVYKGDSRVIDVSKFSKGLYLIYVTDQKGKKYYSKFLRE